MIFTGNMEKESAFSVPTRLFYGIGSLKNLSEEIKKFSVSKVLVVTDKGIRQSEGLKNVEAILNEAGIKYTISDAVQPDPTVESVEKVYSHLQKENCNLLVAVGGGSSIDTAKMVAILATNGGSLSDYDGYGKVKIEPLPIIAIPSTAGTGSEVSMSANVTDSRINKKMSIRHHGIVAKVAILDPVMVSTVPNRVAVNTGLDALTHAIEAFTSRFADPLTDAIALQSIKMIGEYLRPFLCDRSNQLAALSMQMAATMAGIAFASARVGNAHCVARALGGYSHVHIEHGLACAIMLPYVMEYNCLSDLSKFAQIASALGENIEGLSIREAGLKASEAVKQLNEDLGVPRTLREAGVSGIEAGELAERCLSLGYNKWNPRYTSVEDFTRMLEKVL